MKDLRTIVTSVMVMMVLLFIVPSSAFAAENVSFFSAKSNVPTDKTWTIKLNCALDPSINVTNYVSITDSKGNPISVSVNIGDGGQSIMVNPPQGGYVPNEKYTVAVDNELKSKNGKLLTRSVQMDFTVASSTPTSSLTIQSISVVDVTTLKVTLSQAIDVGTMKHFSIVGATISGANLSTDRKTVTLTVSGLENGKSYRLVATGLTADGKVQEEVKKDFVLNTNTFKSALDVQMTRAPQIYKSCWVNASRTETDQYLNPNNYYTGAYKYQFLDLSYSNGIAVSIMKAFLEGKGILAGKENVFKEAGNTYGVSEVYLVAHACLETGNGTSQLANGVVLNGVRVYNIFGINAVDSDPINQGAKKAYEMGWTTPELAIRGGAEWISKLYLNNSSYKQNTLYKMRWNPMLPGSHQYATDVKWAVSQSNAIKKMFDQFPKAILKFDVTSYSDLTGPTIPLSNSLNSLESNPIEDIKPFKWIDINADR